ncbi:MAG: hypothetical protein U5J99_02960 [Parvularculaceae bacterium]|nr:hypothetical protein [Parvularculaceae bacterium]
MPVTEKTKNRFRWESVTAIASGLIALATFAAVFYQAYMMRQQTRAATWPHLSLIRSFEDNVLQIAVRNDGVGPANVVAVVVNVDGEARTSWDEVYAALSIEFHQDTKTSTSSLNNTVFFPGEVRPVLSISGDPSMPEIAQKLRQVSGAICYCSVLNDCFIAGDFRETPAKDHCKAILAYPQFKG